VDDTTEWLSYEQNAVLPLYRWLKHHWCEWSRSLKQRVFLFWFVRLVWVLLVAFWQELPFLWCLWFLFALPSKALTVPTQPVPASLLRRGSAWQAGSSLLGLWPDTAQKDSLDGAVGGGDKGSTRCVFSKAGRPFPSRLWVSRDEKLEVRRFLLL